MAEIRLSIGDQEITSIITATSAREMNLKPGQTAAALIKATEVMIWLRHNNPNCFVQVTSSRKL
jgi:molybdopterin-binding protein